jgi:hypothetical protein
MDEKTLRELWQRAGSDQKIEINIEKLIESTKGKLLNMERLIKIRNRVEIFISVAIFGLNIWWLFYVPVFAVKIGSAIIAAGCLLVICRLVLASKINLKQDNTADIKFELMVSLQLVRQQINLLNSVLWWYLLPFFIGIICIFYAYLHSVLSFSIYTLIVALLYGYIWYKNKRAVIKYLKPLEENLIRLLEELSKPE